MHVIVVNNGTDQFGRFVILARNKGPALMELWQYHHSEPSRMGARPSGGDWMVCKLYTQTSTGLFQSEGIALDADISDAFRAGTLPVEAMIDYLGERATRPEIASWLQSVQIKDI